jgi:stage IV sporulation protein B
MSNEIVVVGFSEIETSDGAKTPAYDAGIRVNDIITQVNGIDVTSSMELLTMIEESGEVIEMTVMRNGHEETYRFTPVYGEDGKGKTGMWIRDTTAGIGTVTYVNPETCEFGGLGHGICDPESGEILKMDRGTVVDVQISGITKGRPGTPGELKGYFSSYKSGVLLENTPCGVYGVFSEMPESLKRMECCETADRREITEGDAVIRCTLDEGEPCEYRIRIENINRTSRDNRSFTVVVTDEALLEKTGGIVQGMSGSPILQNGRIVGAVTHVFVNDPTRGYGIFIENMLAEAK